MSAWSRCGQPRLWQMPFFHSMLRGICRPRLQAEPLGLHRLPDVDVGVADDQHVLARPGSSRSPARSGSPWSRRPGGRPARRPGARGRAGSRAAARRGRRRPRCTPRPRPRPAGRRPRPSRPARRRGGPRRRSGWPGRPAPWCRARRPSRTRCGSWRPGPCGVGGAQDHRHALEQEARRRAGRCGACRAGPRGSRSSGRARRPTISPHLSVVTSSTTRPLSASISTARPRLGARQSVFEDVGSVAVEGHPATVGRPGAVRAVHAGGAPGRRRTSAASDRCRRTPLSSDDSRDISSTYRRNEQSSGEGGRHGTRYRGTSRGAGTAAAGPVRDGVGGGRRRGAPARRRGCRG